jgi:hypothetical protein
MMESVLTFVVVVAAMMPDPLTLLVAVVFGAFAASRAHVETRWAIIVCGVLVVTLALAVLSWRVSTLDGRPDFSFRWAETVVASFLQIYLIYLGVQKWRARRSPPSIAQ